MTSESPLPSEIMQQPLEFPARKTVFAAHSDPYRVTEPISVAPPELRTTEDITERIGTPQLRWKEVVEQPELLTEVLVAMANEISMQVLQEQEDVLPISGLVSEDFNYKVNFLGGNSLLGLYRYANRENEEDDSISFLLKKAEIQPSVEDIKKIRKAGRKIQWPRFYGEPLKISLQKIAADERVKKPASLLSQQDLHNTFDFLGGNLSSLYQHVQSAEDTTEMVPMKHIMRHAGVVVTKEDMFSVVETGGRLPWQQIEGEGLGDFLQQIAEKEINKPLFLWSRRDLIRPLEVLHGYTLGGLANHLYANRGDRAAMEYLQELAVKPVTIADINWALSLNIRFWHKVPSETKRELLETAALERGIPPNTLNAVTMRNGFTFLNGRSLAGLYNETRNANKKKSPKNPLDTIASLIKDNGVTVTVEDVATTMRSRQVLWNRVPNETKKEIIKRIAAEKGKPTIALGRPDFTTPLAFLDGHMATGIYESAGTYDERQGRDVLSVLFETLDIDVPFEDVLHCYTTDIPIYWNRVPDDVIRQFFVAAGDELGIPPAFITSHHMQTKIFDFLQGRTLLKLYKSSVEKERGSNKTAIISLKEKVGLSHQTNARRDYRREEVRQAFDALPIDYLHEDSMRSFVEQKNPDISMATFAWGQFAPWIQTAAQLFERLYAEIQADEIQNQAIVVISDILSTTPEITYADFITQTHAQLEAYCRPLLSTRSREKSFRTPIGNTELTLGDTLQAGPLLPEGTVFTQRTAAALGQLSPLHRRVIEGIIDGWTFEEVADDVNRSKATLEITQEVDNEVLQDVFEDALAILRGELDTNPSDEDQTRGAS